MISLQSKITRPAMLWLALAIIIGGCDKKAPKVPDASFLNFQERLEKDSEFAQNVAETNKTVNEHLAFQDGLGAMGLPYEVLTVQVVVHVLHGTDKVTAELVSRQIEALNRDFRRKNRDELEKAPEAFRQLAADTRIQFALAKQGPKGETSSGIVEKPATAPSFPAAPGADEPQKRNPMKYSASGGSDAWPSERYLNIWVCQLDELLGEGYASLPVDLQARPEEDGVVIDVDYFGFSAKGREKGRALTNLVAKWLGLKDIWGAGKVNGSDDVDDTPAQTGPNAGTPDYPVNNDPQSPYGDMFVNFMDATDDAVRVMFTAGQADRMYATVRTIRPALRNISFGGQAGGSGPLYVIKDYTTEAATGFSTPPSGFYCVSPDLWANGVSTTAGAGFDIPIDNLTDATNYVRARIWNYSPTDPGPTSPAATVCRFYYAKPSTGLSHFPNACWNPVGTYTITGTIANGSSIVTTPVTWPRPTLPPMPTAADLHFCLLARMDGDNQLAACPAACTTASKSCVGSAMECYVGVNKTVAWRNVNFVAPPEKKPSGLAATPPDSRISGVYFSNFTPNASVTKLQFTTAEGETPVFQYGKVVVRSRALLRLWEESGRKGEGVEQHDSTLVLLKEGAYLEGLNLKAGETEPMEIIFEPNENTPKQRDVYVLNVTQFDDPSADHTGNYQYTGNQYFVLQNEHSDKLPEAPPAKPMGEGKPWWFWLIGALILLLLGGKFLFAKKK